MKSATCSISASLNPRVVDAGVPMRSPLVTIGGRGSFGTAFLFTVMLARPSAASASLPVMLRSSQAHEEQMLSVPPETIW